MLSEADIAALFRGLLQRDPDAAAVAWMQSAFTTPVQATRYLLDSVEFTRLESKIQKDAVAADQAAGLALALHQMKEWIPAGCDMAAAERVFEVNLAPPRFILDLQDGG